MRIYWTRRSIPEFAGLSPAVRNKNFRDAVRAVNTRAVYWMGTGLSFAVMIAVLILCPRFINHPDMGRYAGLIIIPGILIGAFIWHQFAIFAMRKYYPHILRRGQDLSGETEAGRLIREANDAEYKRWRVARYALQVGLAALALALMVHL
ncbi:hypothetical protein ABW07_08735 [Pluralibacter gergoviae]|nr:hypothetical protein ABW07_08735 [Pluralibacter gergoviae]